MGETAGSETMSTSTNTAQQIDQGCAEYLRSEGFENVGGGWTLWGRGLEWAEIVCNSHRGWTAYAGRFSSSVMPTAREARESLRLVAQRGC
jgi:hypothetical protein